MSNNQEPHVTDAVVKKLIMESIEKVCKSTGCKEYIEWDCGYGVCISCKLQGESYSIEQIAENCPHKDKFQN